MAQTTPNGSATGNSQRRALPVIRVSSVPQMGLDLRESTRFGSDIGDKFGRRRVETAPEAPTAGAEAAASRVGRTLRTIALRTDVASAERRPVLPGSPSTIGDLPHVLRVQSQLQE